MKKIPKRALVRFDFNVPYDKKGITDDFRIRAALPTIRQLIKKGHQVIICTHWEENGEIPHLDLVAKRLEKLLKTPVLFIKGELPPAGSHFDSSVVLLDNVRLFAGEKKNDAQFARHLASFGDYFVNDAFSVSHRKHASIVSVPRYLPSELGPLMKKEIQELSRILTPRHPFFVALCGKKFSTKEPLIKRFLLSAEHIFVGGAIANAFFKGLGYEIGSSYADQGHIPKSILHHKKIMLPLDVVVRRGTHTTYCNFDKVQAHDSIVDMGPKTTDLLKQYVLTARTILWNGTFGICEEGFTKGTISFAKSIKQSKGYSIAGGGDTVAALEHLKYAHAPRFISTGGGAMLDFLADGKLPGIDAITMAQKKKAPKRF
jgi:3-phosphoglycerate kinase